MTRSVKALGLALVAALALSAVVAATAAAKPKLTPVPEEYPVTLKGKQTVTNVFELENTRPSECATGTSEGTIANKAAAETSEFTSKATYAECTTTILGNKDPMTATLNGCDFQLKATETTSGTIATEGWEVTGKELEIKCPEISSGVFAEIELHVYASKEKDEKNEPLCTYKIPRQKMGGDVDVKLLEKEGEAGTSIEGNATISELAVTRSSGSVTNCGAASQKGTVKGKGKAEAFNAGGTMLRGKWDME